MKKDIKEERFVKQPYFKGGDKALREFVTKHLKYPAISQNNKVEGSVHLKYDIDHKGIVSDVKIIAGLDTHCNEEAIRVVKMLQFIVPKNPRNLRVTFHKKISVHFGINKNQNKEVNLTPIPEAQENQMQNTISSLQYSIVPTSKPTTANPIAKKEKQVSQTYNYTITF